jgi:diguanylate cyclase (GGDEF)-like protein
MRLKSIKSKLVVFATMATLVPSLGLGILSFVQNEAQINSNVTRELRALTNYANREIDLWVDKRVHEAHVTATSNAIIEELTELYGAEAGTRQRRPQALGHYLRSVQGKLEAILELTVVSATGEVVASSAEAPGAAMLPQEWPQNALTEGLIVIPPGWNKQYGAPTLTIAVPISSYDSMLLGALLATLDMRTLQSHLKSSTRYPPGEVLLLDASGRVLVSSQTGSGLMQLDAALLHDLLARPGEALSFWGLTHREVIGLADISTELPVTVLVERERAAVYGAWKELRDMFLVFVGTLVLVVAALAFQMGRSIVVPLQRLIRAADRIADGDLEVRVSATRNDELGHLTQVFNQMVERLQRNRAEIMAANEAMQRQNRILEALSVTDSLTGLYNRSKLDAILTDQLARYQRTQRPFALLMLDIDHFKTLNDTYGHIAGDEILKKVAQILLQSIRSIDFAARYGGDEFIIILVETSADRAAKTAERIRSQVGNLRYCINSSTVPITVSIGIVECQPADTTTTAIFARADNALYEAKRRGRNQAYCAR